MRDLVDLLDRGDLLVVNTTRVLPARLHLVKETGGAAEVLLLEERQIWVPAAGRPWCVRAVGCRRARCCAIRPVPRCCGSRWVTTWVTASVWSSPVHPPSDRSDRRDRGRRARSRCRPTSARPLADPERYQTVYAEIVPRRVGGRPHRRASPDSRRCSKRSRPGAHVRRRSSWWSGWAPSARSWSTGRGPRHARRALSRAPRRPSTPASPPSAEADGWWPSAPPRCGRWRARRHRRARGSHRAVHPRRLRVPGGRSPDDQLPSAPLVAAGHDRRVRRRRPGRLRHWRDLYAQALADDYRFLSFGDAMLLTAPRPTGIGR